MNRWTARGVALLTLLTGIVLLAPNVSRAATIEHGWWWRAHDNPTVYQPPAPPVSVPVPPPAPPAPPTSEGGLQVSALPDGAFAVAAVRVDEELTSITLRVAPNGDTNGENAKLAACAAATAWEPVAAGPWQSKPVVACDLINGGGSVAGVRASDGSSWTFPVAPLVNEGKTDVVIVPLIDSEVAEGVAVPFTLVFVPPTEADLVVAPTIEEPRASPEEEAATEELFSDPAAYEELISFGDAPTVAAPAVRPALDEADQAPVLPVFAAADDPDNASQILGAFFVLLALAAFMWASRLPTPAIQSMVRGGREIPGVAPQVGGLGRFARIRAGKPPPLQ